MYWLRSLVILVILVTVTLFYVLSPAINKWLSLVYPHLYGEYQGHEWKATIEIYEWCEVMHCFT